MADYYKHLAYILHKAQGVIDPETRQEIDVGEECVALRHECDALTARVRELEAEVQRLEVNGIHSCWDECPRIACVQARHIRELETRLAAQGEELGKLRELLDYWLPKDEPLQWQVDPASLEHKIMWRKARAALGVGDE